MTDKRINKLKRKLQEARYRLLTREPELAAPLVEMLFVTNVDVRRMSTNGSCIYFDASWLESSTTTAWILRSATSSCISG